MTDFIVAGTFDTAGGKPSYFGKVLIEETGFQGINGGSINELDSLDFSKFNSLIWIPFIDNKVDKFLPMIKKKNRKLLLVSSKRIIEKEYEITDVIGRLLKSHSNLGIMISKDNGIYNFKLIDPLGNMYADTDDIKRLAKVLKNRINFASSLTRYPSVYDGEVGKFCIENDFIRIVKKCGEEFSKHINAININRFLGNAATRCSYGFPGVRQNDKIFVSKRNVDKNTIASKDFVEVKLENKTVHFKGNSKPSVDSPIQLFLFDYYKDVNYIVHGHVYIKFAEMTSVKIPCGCLEEVNQVMNLFDRSESNFCVNLRGHGCLIMAKDLDYLEQVKFESRPFPEV